MQSGGVELGVSLSVKEGWRTSLLCEGSGGANDEKGGMGRETTATNGEVP